jgi:hypothetical protein
LQTVPSQAKAAGGEEGAKEGRGQRQQQPRDLFQAAPAQGRRPAGGGKQKGSPLGTSAATKKHKTAKAAAPKGADGDDAAEGAKPGKLSAKARLRLQPQP